MPKVEMVLSFDFLRELTEQEVADVLDVEDTPARELLTGMIAFEPDELKMLARAKGVTLEELVKIRKVFDD